MYYFTIETYNEFRMNLSRIESTRLIPMEESLTAISVIGEIYLVDF